MPQSVSYVIGSPTTEDWEVITNGDVDFTITEGGVVMLAGAPTGQTQIHLPAASDSEDRVIVVKKTDSTTNGVVVNPNASETIDGALTLTLTVQYASVMLISDGSNWFIL